MSGLYGNATGGFCNPQTYILTDGNGKEITGVLVENVTVFDATTDDVRLGKTYAADEGVKVGTNDIPAYHTTTGVYYVPANSELKIVMTNGDRCDYTELQAMVMPYNSSVNDSNAVNKDSADPQDGEAMTSKLTLYARAKSITVGSNILYFKANGLYKSATKVYKKVSGTWVQQEDLSAIFSGESSGTASNYVYGGSV